MEEYIQNYTSIKNSAKHCFILGILHRSGTNYLYRLLREHRDCAGSGPIWEDFFLHHSHQLKNYFDSVKTEWDSKWGIENKIGEIRNLEQYLGNGIKQILDYQLNFFPERTNPKIILTKTPSVQNINNFYDFFPNDHLIVIVRDGRSLVESGVRSFGWNYDMAMRKWARRAKEIIDLRNSIKNSHKKLLILKYEDIYLDEKKELVKIFNFLGVNPETYDYAQIENLGITGSSELRKKEGKVHWDITQKDKVFNPLGRSKNWSAKRKNRFTWVAGRHMIDLGYEIDPMPDNFIFNSFNSMKDIMWNIIDKLIAFKKAIEMVRKINGV